MNKTQKPRKLALQPETVRALRADDLIEVAGGLTVSCVIWCRKTQLAC